MSLQSITKVALLYVLEVAFRYCAFIPCHDIYQTGNCHNLTTAKERIVLTILQRGNSPPAVWNGATRFQKPISLMVSLLLYYSVAQESTNARQLIRITRSVLAHHIRSLSEHRQQHPQPCWDKSPRCTRHRSTAETTVSAIFIVDVRSPIKPMTYAPIRIIVILTISTISRAVPRIPSSSADTFFNQTGARFRVAGEDPFFGFGRPLPLCFLMLPSSLRMLRETSSVFRRSFPANAFVALNI